MMLREGWILNEQRPSSSKKPYQQPSLLVYGDIRLLTQSVSMHAHIRDAMVPRKTA
jgi:hypothetical protein